MTQAEAAHRLRRDRADEFESDVARLRQHEAAALADSLPSEGVLEVLYWRLLALAAVTGRREECLETANQAAVALGRAYEAELTLAAAVHDTAFDPGRRPRIEPWLNLAVAAAVHAMSLVLNDLVDTSTGESARSVFGPTL